MEHTKICTTNSLSSFAIVPRLKLVECLQRVLSYHFIWHSIDLKRVMQQQKKFYVIRMHHAFYLVYKSKISRTNCTHQTNCVRRFPFTRTTQYTQSKKLQWKIIIITMEWAKKGISNIAHMYIKIWDGDSCVLHRVLPLWTFNLFRSVFLHHSFCRRLSRSFWYFMFVFAGPFYTFVVLFRCFR